MSIENFLSGVGTLAIVCNQWGDTGKGKIVDFFSGWADIIARGTGGANAGHTIKIGDKTYIFHLIPCGIIYDSEGKTNVIGNGVAFNPRAVLDELKFLNENGLSYNNLKIAYNAKLVLPQHIVMDKLERGRIGTTGRGIGPVYTDDVARKGLIVSDMLNKDIFKEKLKENLEDKLKLLSLEDPEAVRREIEKIEAAFFKPGEFFDVDAIVEQYTQYGRELREMVIDTDDFMRGARSEGKRILLEGAQGLLLSVKYGTYPFVTGSDCSVQGLANGAGLSERDVDLTLGVVKAFYITRVGKGPFPTELGGKKSAEHCDNEEHTREYEEKKFPDVSVNDKDKFRQGVAIRRAGGEYGATTGRPRRVGWLDLPLLRHAIKINGPNIILTKLDVLKGCDEIKICFGYTCAGPDYVLGRKVIRQGELIDVAIPQSEILENCKPQYRTFNGGKTDISRVREYDDLPKEVISPVDYIEAVAKVNIRALSVGAERKQMILR